MVQTIISSALDGKIGVDGGPKGGVKYLNQDLKDFRIFRI
jgi:hypothetical protein